MNITNRESLLFGIAGAVCCIMFFALITAASYHTEHALSICSRCGARVSTETTFFTWSTRPAGEVDRIVSSRPTILSELWNTSGTCRHGGFAANANGKLSGPQTGNPLILIESHTDTPLGRFGPYQHATGFGKWQYEHFYQPDGPSAIRNSEFDFAQFRSFLLKKKQENPQFPEQFRYLIQTELPGNNTLAEDLVKEFEKSRVGSDVKE